MAKKKIKQRPVFQQYRLTEKDVGKNQIVVAGRLVEIHQVKAEDVGKVVHVNLAVIGGL